MSVTKPVQASLADFELGEEVAWGSLATILDVVYKKNGKHYALKVLNKQQLAKKKVVRSAMVEKDALVALGTNPHRHPGVIRLHHCFHDLTHLYYVLDLAANGDLKTLVQKLGSISLNCARYYTAQLVDAVLYLHESGVAHRDIKPENILLDGEMRIMLADFGCAYIGEDMQKPRTNTFVGTAAYISPELLARSEANPTSPDVWAIGCTLFFFLFGTSPFMAATDYLTMKRVRALDYIIPPVCDSDAADLIKRLLVLDPLERIGVPPKSSPEDIRQHSFFVGGKRSTLEKEAWSIIDWNVLWTDPPPEIVVGPYYSRPQESSTGDLWESFDGIRLGDDE